jgi:hypothetical protein
MISTALLAQNQDLNVGGWIMLIGCVGLVCGLCTFCYYRVLREPKPSEHHHAPLDIDTHDRDT